MSVHTITRHVAHPGAGDDLVAAFGSLRILEVAGQSGGLTEARLLRSVVSDVVVVVATWETDDDFQRWLDNPDRLPLAVALEPLLAEPPTGERYVLAHAVTKL